MSNPLFRGPRDRNFLLKLNQELIERVIQEKITYYSISEKFTRKNIYGEAKEKIFDPPVEIFCLIDWQDQDTTTTQYGQDRVYNISVSILKKHMQDINMVPREGDFIEYSGKRFEIKNVNSPGLIWGKETQDLQYNLECQSVRESGFITSISGTETEPLRTVPDTIFTASFRYEDVTFPYSGSQ